MPDKFKNKYRIPSARLQNWDYRWQGTYFITICTQNRENYFGKIVDGNMKLSAIGIIADIMWHEIKNHETNVALDAFVVMPNHVHGILILAGDDNDKIGIGRGVETLHATSLPNEKNKSFANISPKSGSVSAIIRSYKSAVTKNAHRLGFDFKWQSRFHDHIIRDGKSFENIRNYIFENPMNWENDGFKKS